MYRVREGKGKRQREKKLLETESDKRQMRQEALAYVTVIANNLTPLEGHVIQED